MKTTFTLLALLLSGCTVQFVSQYDPITDASISKLQRDTQAFMVELERTAGTPDGVFDKYQKQYDVLHIDETALRLRAEAIPNNKLTLDEIADLDKQIEIVQRMHRQGLSKLDLVSIEDAFNRIYGALLKLELAKKDFRPPAAK